MKELTITVPAMWADHHVLAARTALAGVEGIGAVEASARDFTLRVAFDPATIASAAIVATLAGAGYVEGAAPGAGEPESAKAAWGTGGTRTTTTNPADAAMSGDYRKY
jgi:copper chaperone CopZ